MLVKSVEAHIGSTHELYFQKERIMTEERRDREIRHGQQNICGSDKAANSSQVGVKITLVAASGTLHHVFQCSWERASKASPLNSLNTG